MGYTRKGARDIWRRQNRTHLNLLPRLSGRVLKDAAKEYHPRPELCGYLHAERATLSTLHLMLNQEIEDIRVRIRATRLALGWSLADFELHSAGAITSVAMGSYERGTRALSITKLLTICNIFQISIIHILAPGQELTTGKCASRHIYDLRALQGLPDSEEKAHLLSYIHQIIKERGDWKGAVVSLRATDIQNLGIIFAVSQEMENHNYLLWLDAQDIALQKN